MDSLSEKQRWVFFLLIAISIFAFTTMQEAKRQNAILKQKQKEEQLAKKNDKPTTGTTALNNSDNGTTGTIAQNPDVHSPVKDNTNNTNQVPQPRRNRTFVDFEGVTEKDYTIHNGKMEVVLSNRGGNPKSWKLILPPNGNPEGEEIQLIPPALGRRSRELPLEVNFTERKDETYHRINELLFKSTLKEDDGTTTIQFVSATINNLQLIKTYTFHKDSLLSDLSVKLVNHSASRIKIEDTNDYGLSVSWGAGFRVYEEELTHQDTIYINNVFSTENGISYEVPKKGETEEVEGKINWAGQHGRFFAALIIPKQSGKMAAVQSTYRKKNTIPEKHSKFFSDPYTTSLYSNNFHLESVNKGDNLNVIQFDYKIFTGPKSTSILKEISEPLAAFSENDQMDMTNLLFYDTWFGWMRAIKIFLLWALNAMYGYVGNWGLSIIFLTIIVRLLMHPLVHKSMKEMAKNAEMMKKYKPELDVINEKYKEDPMKRQQKMMELMKEHGFNPLAAPLRGCLPILLQLPIFLALYHILGQSYNLRGAHFMWIQDLSMPDHFISWSTITGGLITKIAITKSLLNFGEYLNILPIIYGVSQLALTKFNSSAQATMDPNQKMMMYMFPIIIPFMLYNLPSGLFVYWIVSNFWQFAHQIYAKKFVHDHPEEVGVVETAKAK